MRGPPMDTPMDIRTAWAPMRFGGWVAGGWDSLGTNGKRAAAACYEGVALDWFDAGGTKNDAMMLTKGQTAWKSGHCLLNVANLCCGSREEST